MTRISRIRSAAAHLPGGRAAIASLSLAAVGLVAVPVAAAVTPTTGPASGGASTSTTDTHGTERSPAANLENARQRCLSALDRRQATVRRYLADVHAATGAPAADRAKLTDQLEDLASDLAAARSTIESADTASGLRHACGQMVTSTRVFRLYGPKTHALVATSRLHVLDSRIEAHEGRVAQAITRATERGVPAQQIAAARTALAAVTDRLADLHTKIDPLAGQLLPITVAQVNDGSAESALTGARTALRSARADVAAIRADLRSIRDDLSTH